MAIHNIIVNKPPSPNFEDNKESKTVRQDLIGFICPRIEAWRDHRDENFKDKWDEYYRLWRGVWNSKDRVRNAERSRLISPALQQAIAAQVAEFEEATFARAQWFTIQDDVQDQESQDISMMSKLLMEDFTKDKVSANISEVYLNAALYGTGIAKVVVTKDPIVKAEIGESGQVEPTEGTRLSVKLVAVDPYEFVIEPTAKSINESMGVAQEMLVPRHTVLKKQEEGIYYNVPIGNFEYDSDDFLRSGEHDTRSTDGRVKITEYYGLVPRSFMPDYKDELSEEKNDAVVALLAPNQSRDGLLGEIDDEDLIEAWVTIADDDVILRAIENPFILKDRPFVAYQHDTVPNRFWGRGVAELGYNVQKALDGELRARMDTLALSTYPMLAMDQASVPRDSDFSVRPGRTILTSGDPNSAIREFRFTEPGPASFRETAELERMIQMATGSMDSATPVGTSPRNATASGMSMISAGALKRQKRTLQNIERDFLAPVLEKLAYRYMQFSPDRYPFKDYDFKITSGIGLIARELELANLTQMLQTTPPNTPSYYMIIRNIWKLSAVESRDEMVALTDQMLQNSMQPQPNPEVELKQQELKLKEQEILLNQQKFAWERLNDIAEHRAENRRINQRSTEYAIDMQKVEASRPQIEATALDKTASAIEKLAKASSEENAKSLDSLKQQVASLEDVLGNVHQEGEVARAEATSEYMDIVKRLEERAVALEAKEPIIKQVTGQQGPAGPPGQFPPEMMEMMTQLYKSVEELKTNQNKEGSKKETGSDNMKIVRDGNGLIQSVNGKQVKRNSQGLIEEI